jgi:hypothetical protein
LDMFEVNGSPYNGQPKKCSHEEREKANPQLVGTERQRLENCVK